MAESQASPACPASLHMSSSITTSPSASIPSGGSAWCSRDSVLATAGTSATNSCVVTLVVRITFPPSLPRFTTCSSSSAALRDPLLVGTKLTMFTIAIGGPWYLLCLQRIKPGTRGTCPRHSRFTSGGSTCAVCSSAIVAPEGGSEPSSKCTSDPGGSSTGISSEGVSATRSSKVTCSMSESMDNGDPATDSECISSTDPAPSFDFFVLRSSRSSSSEDRWETSERFIFRAFFRI
nr:hypothetical protein Iba_chr12cCG11100 [Ipomoea batatas]